MIKEMNKNDREHLFKNNESKKRIQERRNPCFSGQCFAIAPKNARNRAKNSKYCLDFRSFCASHKI